jgi:hypothetical protein
MALSLIISACRPTPTGAARSRPSRRLRRRNRLRQGDAITPTKSRPQSWNSWAGCRWSTRWR